MNISLISTGAGKESQSSGVIYAGNLMMNRNAGLKSTQQKQERQQKMQSEVAFWEKQKESLKDMECATVEEIVEKLEKLHTYEDSITAAKQAYNSEQMWHTMDEAREIGEKIAEAVEEMAPKTEEERKEEAIEAATGTEESGGMLEELLEEAGELAEDLVEENEELFYAVDETDIDITEESQEAAKQARAESELRMEKEADETLAGKVSGEVYSHIAQYDSYHSMWAREWYTAYRGMDVRL